MKIFKISAIIIFIFVLGIECVFFHYHISNATYEKTKQNFCPFDKTVCNITDNEQVYKNLRETIRHEYVNIISTTLVIEGILLFLYRKRSWLEKMGKQSLIKLGCIISAEVLVTYLFMYQLLPIDSRINPERFLPLIGFIIIFTLYFYLEKVIKKSEIDPIKKETWYKRWTSIGTALLVLFTSLFDHAHHSDGFVFVPTIITATIYFFMCMLLASSCLIENKSFSIALVIRTFVLTWVTLIIFWLIILNYIIGNLM